MPLQLYVNFSRNDLNVKTALISVSRKSFQRQFEHTIPPAANSEPGVNTETSTGTPGRPVPHPDGSAPVAPWPPLLQGRLD